MQKRALTYKKAGVDIDAGERFVRMITPLARKTFRPGVMTDIGSFGALFRLDRRKYREPVLVSGTDGVGTKLKVAFMMDRHDTVGIDLVAMCVNDILTSGAEPLFFLDYFATGKLNPETAVEVMRGVAEGCKQAGCSLIGGETAEMPGFYERGEYDLSGFAVGAVEQGKIIDGRRIKAGDVIIGVASNGLHSNGYSLARKVLLETKKTNLRKVLGETGRKLGDELLMPTRIYVGAFNALRNKVDIKGMAHITGGGIPGNLSRILPEGKGAIINQRSWSVPPIFELIQEYGEIPEVVMRKTFNMGIGFIFVVDDGRKDTTIKTLQRKGFGAYLLGYVEKGIKGVRFANA
jgi:phosphoribosylformylglycinamidine cyclo-ligase